MLAIHFQLDLFNMEPKDLIDAGLTSNQAKVYLKIVKEPAQSGGQIAKGMSMDRSFVYNVLAALSDKGLISHIFKDNIKIFYPTDPESLLKESEEKKERITTLVEELNKIKGTIVSEEKRIVLVYNGRAGLKVFMRDLLECATFSSLGGGGLYNIFDVLKNEFPHYLKVFDEKKTHGKIITSPENEENMKRTYNNLNIEIRTMEGLNNTVCFTLFSDKLAIYSLEEKPYVIMIEDKSVADTLTEYFNKVWETLK